MRWKITAIDPPAPRQASAKRIGLALAGVFLIFALLHLIRIDQLATIITETLGETGAKWFLALITIGEVLALPYVLRIRLSPLFRIVSGLLVVLVPLTWVSLSIWAHGNGHSTGQFSSYLSSPSTWWLILLDLLWLGVSYWYLWLSNYDHVFRNLRKR